MNKLAKAFVVILVIFLLVIGGVLYFNVFKKPSVNSVDLSWGNVSEESTELVAEVEVNNSNPFGFDFGFLGAEYNVTANDVLIGEGDKENIKLEKGRFPMRFVVDINNSKLSDWWVSHLRNDEVSVFEFQGDLVVDLFFTELSFDLPSFSRDIETDLVSRLSLDSEKEISYGDTTFFVIEEIRSSWGSVSEESSIIDSVVVVRNPNDVSLPLTELRYELFMNEIKMGEGSTEEAVVIDGGSSRELNASIVLDNSKLSEWWVSHLRNEESSDVRVEVSAVFEAFGEEFSVSVDSYSREFNTDLLG